MTNLRFLPILLLLSSTLACGKTAKQHEAANECFNGHAWEACGTGSKGGESIMHKPKAGCPKGYKNMPGAFAEKDGTHRDGCMNFDGGDGSIDVLYGGESFNFVLSIPVPQDVDDSAPPRKEI